LGFKEVFETNIGGNPLASKVNNTENKVLDAISKILGLV